MKIAAACKISTFCLRSVTFIIFIVALFNFRTVINTRVKEYRLRRCSFCQHLTLVLIHFPIGIAVIIGMYMAAINETHTNDVLFAITRITFTLEDKIDLLIILYVLVQVYQHYKVVKGVFIEEALAREREIMTSEIWDSEIGSERGSMYSVRLSSTASRDEMHGDDKKINRSQFDISDA